MLAKVSPGRVKGALQAPSSKSCTQRALAAALLRPGVSIIENVGTSNDELAAMNIIQSLGARIEHRDNAVVVSSDPAIFGQGSARRSLVIDCGESGLSVRMFASIVSLFHFDIVLTGHGSILTRPMDFLDEYLPQLGVEIKSNDGRLPITFKGPLAPKDIRVNGSLSSQFLTGLLFAFSRAALKPVTITVDNLTSQPYIDLTLSVLKEFGLSVINNDYQSFDILPVKSFSSSVIRYKVEGDWSNAAFLLVSGAVSGTVTLKGLDTHSTQGDRRILDALYESGADVVMGVDSIQVNSSKRLKAFDFDATQCPDLFPPLVALAANCDGVSHFRGVNRLLHKESNRAIALRDEFGKMGVRIDLNNNEMSVHGTTKMRGAKVSSHNDHRIAMAATVAALNSQGTMEISGAEAVNKSYPGFYEDMKKIGVRLTVS